MEKKTWLFLIIAIVLAVVIVILATGTGPMILEALGAFAATTGVAILRAPFLFGLSNIYAALGLLILAIVGMPLIMWGLYKVALHKITDKIRGAKSGSLGPELQQTSPGSTIIPVAQVQTQTQPSTITNTQAPNPFATTAPTETKK